jgi:hypothetical protein
MTPIFDCRLDAAGQLAAALADYHGCKPVVLALARGAVGMGAAIADEFGGELEVALVRKLRAPFCAQLAVGAVDDAGWTYIARHAPGAGADPRYLATEKAAQLFSLRRQRALYGGSREPLDLKGRTVIVVDDGIATGTTMITALLAARSRHAARLVCAVPVVPADTLVELAPCADEFVCLEVPERFDVVGAFYRSFPEVSDEQTAAFVARRAAARV